MQQFQELVVGRPVAVRWADSSFKGGWHYESKGDRPAPVLKPLTLGVVVALDEEALTLASTVIDGGYLNPVSIPLGAILNVRAVSYEGALSE